MQRGKRSKNYRDIGRIALGFTYVGTNKKFWVG